MYFGHYTRVLYIAQTDCKKLRAKAVQAAAELGLDYEYRYAGYGEFADFIRGLPHHGGRLKTQKGFGTIGEIRSARMANLITLYWRDIPAQVIAERGRGRKREQAKLNCRDVFRLPLMPRRCAMVWTRPMIIFRNGAERSPKNAARILRPKLP